jgi:iron-sulfur cluster protein
VSDRTDRAARIRHLLDTEGPAVAENTKGLNERRYETIRDLENYDDLRDRAREIKEEAVERLPELIERVTATVEENGGSVYVADDADDANDYVREVCRERDAEGVVKSKSMTTEEIDLNEALEADGVSVTETDLGEWVVQVADEAPSHIVAPAVHRSRESITDLFAEAFDLEDPPDSAEALTAFARERLMEDIAAADVGVTGANFVAADSGTLALVTNEGNARKCAVTPDTHVAVAGVEKLIPSVHQLPPFLELIGRAGAGQELPAYLSLLTPPVDSPTVDFDAPDETLDADAERAFHLVLVDNGRMAMREDDDLRETLYCIRCGACANSCANFQHVGGHAFGGETYTGGIATGWEAGVEGLDTAAEFNDLCTGCSRCVDACPVKIDIPWINTVVRDRVNRGADPGRFDHLVEGLTPDAEPAGLDPGKRLFGNVGALARAGSALAPVSNWVGRSRPARWLLERVAGVDARRPLPEFERESLVAWFDARGSRLDDPDREVVLYPDVYSNYVDVERGKAAVRALEAVGVAARVPAVPESGRAPLSQGMVTTARTAAEGVADALDPHLDAGRDVVVVEPSDLAMFRRDYDHLLDDGPAARLRERSRALLPYLRDRLDDGADADALAAGDGEAVAYHAHCQGRTLGLEAPTVDLLERLGYDVLTSDVECCGMAGSFGYKREYYELSVDVGEDLREQFDAPDAADRTVVADGTSCVDQLEWLLERRARHPVSLVAPTRV